jgi:hypothetical protein
MTYTEKYILVAVIGNVLFAALALILLANI